MIHSLLSSAETSLDIENASAHCDIPCKIYDPSTAIIAALSVVRLMDIMKETAENGDPSSLETQNTLARCVLRKEEEAEKAKHEIRVIWGDYIKAPQMEKFPEVNEVAHSIMLAGSACKQSADREKGLALVEAVNKFAEIFWASKDIPTTRKTCPYPPSLDVVYPTL